MVSDPNSTILPESNQMLLSGEAANLLVTLHLKTRPRSQGATTTSFTIPWSKCGLPSFASGMKHSSA
jgi:hypothetical protein